MTLGALLPEGYLFAIAYKHGADSNCSNYKAFMHELCRPKMRGIGFGQIGAAHTCHMWAKQGLQLTAQLATSSRAAPV